MTQAEDENKDGVKQKPAKLRPLDAAKLDALGGEPLAGSGFEEETSEEGFSLADISAQGFMVVGSIGHGKMSGPARMLLEALAEKDTALWETLGDSGSEGEPGASGPAPDQSQG